MTYLVVGLIVLLVAVDIVLLTHRSKSPSFNPWDEI